MSDNQLVKNKAPKVTVYMGGIHITGKSGIGKAIYHQIDMLTRAGIRVNDCRFLQSDIVHFNTIFPDSVLLALLARLAGIKVVYYGHSTMEDFKNSFKGSNFFAPAFKQWIKFCYSLGDIVVTPTAYSKEMLQSYGIKKPIVALSNGIDVGFWRSTGEEKEYRQRKKIISVGHFIERKGIVEFLEVAKKNPQYDFVWYGHTNLSLIPEYVRTAIVNAPANVSFPGYVSSEILKEAYETSDVFLFMSHEETEGIVVLEAMASGIPIIVRDIPVYEGWIRDGVNAYVFTDDGSVDDILKKALEEDNSSIVEGARKTANERDYGNMGRMLFRTYCEYFA